METKINIKKYIDSSDRIIQLPQKQRIRYALLEYLSGKFQFETMYSEKQVNEICNQWHTFNDYFLLRRELVDYGFMGREKDGSRYWRERK